MDYSIQILCRNIYYLRKRHNLTQKQMAEIMGISPGTLGKIEKSETPPRINSSVLCRVCDYFHISADTILHEYFWKFDRAL